MAEERNGEKNIALRSEKVRNIVGKIPPAVDRYGIMAIGLVLVVVWAVSMLIPYKETLRFSVRFDPSQSKTVGTACVDVRQAKQLHEGMLVAIAVGDETVVGEVVTISKNRVNGKIPMTVKTRGSDEVAFEGDLDAEVVLLERSWFEALTEMRP
mgnify:FL=1